MKIFRIANSKTMDKKSTDKNGLMGNGFFIFFVGPIFFLIIGIFIGYGLFYDQDADDNSRKRFVFLLSSGAAFYLVVIIVLALTGNIKCSNADSRRIKHAGLTL